MEETTGVTVEMAGQEAVTNDVTPPPAEAAPDSPPVETPPKAEGEETLPFGKHPRWQKMVRTNKELTSKVAEFEQTIKALEGAKALDTWIREDPEGVYEWLGTQIKRKGDGGEQPSSPDDIPYEELYKKLDQYDDETANIMRFILKRQEKHDAIAKEYEDIKIKAEENSKKTMAERIQSNRAELDEEFDRLAADAGLIDKEGNCDEEEMDVIANATLSKLHAIAKDPKLPTKSELKTAFEAILKGLKKGKKAVPPPPSGSKRGTPPAGKSTRTEQDRINDIVGSI